MVRLLATRYHRLMTSGRTQPAIFGCEDQHGASVGEYVVKLRGTMETGGTGLTCELLASLVARHLGISAPEPALIALDPALFDHLAATHPSWTKRLRASQGVNFGTRVIIGGGATWPQDEPVAGPLRRPAAEIFAFDAMIQNPDRKCNNPNLLRRGNEIFVIDHEAAFSFLYAIGQQDPPWELNRLGFLEQHVFYRPLHGVTIELDPFAAALESMTDQVVNRWMDEVPREWGTEPLPRIAAHLQAVRMHSTEFAEQVRRRLA